MNGQTPEELLDTAAQNAFQATLAINRDRDAGGAIALSTLAIAQALIAYGSILISRKDDDNEKDGTADQPPGTVPAPSAPDP